MVRAFTRLSLTRSFDRRSSIAIAPASRLLLGGCIALAAALVGCSTHSPATPPNLGFIETRFLQTAPGGADALDAMTWRGFGDPALEDLITQRVLQTRDAVEVPAHGQWVPSLLLWACW